MIPPNFRFNLNDKGQIVLQTHKETDSWHDARYRAEWRDAGVPDLQHFFEQLAGKYQLREPVMPFMPLPTPTGG